MRLTAAGPDTPKYDPTPLFMCEPHDAPGHCDQECLDLAWGMDGGGYSDFPYDPTGCNAPMPMPEWTLYLDTETHAVMGRYEHPAGECQCGEATCPDVIAEAAEFEANPDNFVTCNAHGEARRCPCGNTAESDGFVPCHGSGMPVEPYATDAGLEGIDLPWDGKRYVCVGGCGRTHDQTTIEPNPRATGEDDSHRMHVTTRHMQMSDTGLVGVGPRHKEGTP